MILKNDKKYCCKQCSYMIEGVCKHPDASLYFDKATFEDVFKEHLLSKDLDEIYVCSEFIQNINYKADVVQW